MSEFEEMHENLISEIRLNPSYTHLFWSKSKDIAGNDTEPAIIQKTINTNSYLKRLNHSRLGDITVIPPNCRYIEQVSDGGYIVVIEEPPALRTVKFNYNFRSEYESLVSNGKAKEYGFDDDWWYTVGEKNKVNLQLAFPYVIFILYIDPFFVCRNGSAFLRKNQMSGLSDYLCLIPLPNISSNQSICYGNYIDKTNYSSFYQSIQNAIMVYWAAEFNHDYSGNYEEYKKNNIPIVNNFLEWSALSKIDPMFIFKTDFLRHKRDIKEQILSMKEKFKLSSNSEIVTFKTMKDIFTKKEESGESLSNARGKKYPIFYDVCQGIYLTETLYLNVGDTIKLKNGDKAFVETFAGILGPEGSIPKYIILDHNGRKLRLKITSASKMFIKRNVEEQLFKKKSIINNVEIKPGDVLVIKSNDGSRTYKRVEYIRDSRFSPDVDEINLSGSYYLSNSVAIESLLDKSKISLNGVLMDPKMTYGLSSGNSSSPIKKYDKYKFVDIDINSSGMVIKLQSQISGRTIATYSENPTKHVFPINDAENFKDVFRIGRHVYYVTSDCINPEMVYRHNSCIFYEAGSGAAIDKPKKSYYSNLIKDDTFTIKGNDFDTTFKIGDKVVVANWSNPIDVLTVKTITAFKFDSENIYFSLTDKNNNVSDELYVDCKYGAINTGKIRRVTNEVNGLKVGTKIQAKNAGITCFPKKDINIIVAFIIDGPYEPQVLCSNGCTLWYSDVIEKFDMIEISDKRWSLLNHVPLDVSKIKPQTGDIMTFNPKKIQSSFIVVYDYGLKYLNMSDYNYDYPYFATYGNREKERSIFDCIPTPRMSGKRMRETRKAKLMLDFHGGACGKNGVISLPIDYKERN